LSNKTPARPARATGDQANGKHREATQLGIVTTTSETAFTQSAETVYDFVTNPENWTKTYPGSAHIGNLPELPLKVGDTWEEAGADGERIFSWQLAIAVGPSLFVFSSIGRLGPQWRRRPGGPDHRDVPVHQAWAGRHTVLPDHDDRGLQTCAAARPTLSGGQSGQDRCLSRGRRARTRSIVRLTPAPAVRDTFAVFCKGVRG
jgi:hypothetical protein